MTLQTHNAIKRSLHYGANKTLHISGRVIDRQPLREVLGLLFEVWNKDLIYDNQIGSVYKEVIA